MHMYIIEFQKSFCGQYNSTMLHELSLVFLYVTLGIDIWFQIGRGNVGLLGNILVNSLIHTFQIPNSTMSPL